MATRRSGVRLIEVLLIAAVIGVAVLPSPNCGRLSQPEPISIDYSVTCKDDEYTAVWDKLSIYSVYANVGRYAPQSGAVRAHPPNVHISDNSFGGVLSNPSTDVEYLVEGHPHYIPDAAIVGGFVNVGSLIVKVDDVEGQTVTLEYLSNSKTIYVTIHYLAKPREKGQTYIHTRKTYYHRIHCSETYRPNADGVYRGLFSSIDAILGRDACRKEPIYYTPGRDHYEIRRIAFINRVMAKSCDIDAETSKVRPLFDCVKAFDIIPKVFGVSYSEMLANNVKDMTISDHVASGCTFFSMRVEGKPGDGYVRLAEYYGDPMHPMIAYDVIIYELDIGRRTLFAKVFNAPGYAVSGHVGLYPHERAVMVLDHINGIAKLDDCNTRPIFDAMVPMDKNYRNVINYESIGIKYNLLSESDQLLWHSKNKYSENRRYFAADIIKHCGAGRFFEDVYRIQEKYASGNTTKYTRAPV